MRGIFLIVIKHWYNVSMEIDMNENNWSNTCPKYDCRKDLCKCGLKYVNIPASLGDDSEGSNVAPKNGAYCNALVIYEANNHVYIYSKEGVPTLIDVDASDISTLEQEVIKAQKDIHEFREDIDKYAFFFNTIADMRNSDIYSSGSVCVCLGNVEYNDGGTAIFKIRNMRSGDVIDGVNLISLPSTNLVAERIIPDIEREDDSKVSVDSVYSYDLKAYYTKMTIPKNHFSINLVYYWDSYQDGVYKYVHEHPGSVYSNGPLKSPTIIDGQIKINAVPSDSEYWYILGTDTNGDIKYTKDVYREKTGSQLKDLGYQNCFGIWCPIRINGTAFNASAELNHSDPNYNYIINSNIPMCIFGYDDDNYYVIIVEGRNPRSLGIRFNQAVALMEELNIPNAFNMDGGGSCELWASNPTVNLVYGDKNVATLGYSSHRAWELIKFTKES